MPDLVVSLYSTQLAELKHRADHVGASIRPALPPELHLVVNWVREHFSENWASEVSVAFSRQPVACLVAVAGGMLKGFACYDTTRAASSARPALIRKRAARGSGSRCFPPAFRR